MANIASAPCGAARTLAKREDRFTQTSVVANQQIESIDAGLIGVVGSVGGSIGGNLVIFNFNLSACDADTIDALRRLAFELKTSNHE